MDKLREDMNEQQVMMGESKMYGMVTVAEVWVSIFLLLLLIDDLRCCGSGGTVLLLLCVVCCVS